MAADYAEHVLKCCRVLRVEQVVEEAAMYYNPPTGKISKLKDIGFEGCPCQDEDGDRVRPRHKPTCV